MTEILHETEGNPVPPNHFAGHFETRDRLKLRFAVFRSDIQPPRGTVVLVHGRNECIEKYFETIRDFNAQGLWVATFDWRGQGLSARQLKNRRRGHARRISDFVGDLEDFLERVVLPDAKLPFFLVAHSMGGLISLKAAPRLTNRIERMVVMAPFVGGSVFRIPQGTLRMLARTLSMFGMGWMQLSKDEGEPGFKTNMVTSDPERYARNQEILARHPDLAIGPPTASWIATMIESIAEVQTIDYLRTITIPCLVLAPNKDRIIPYSAFEELSQKFRAGKLVTIHGAGHELMQERDIFREQALAAIFAFIPGSDAEPMVFSGD